MKRFIVFSSVILLFSCADKTGNKKDSVAAANTTTTSSSVAAAVTEQPGKTWIENFRIFRDAVYHNEPAKARLFVDLVVLNENKHIWNIIPNSLRKTKADDIFSDQDYYKNFTVIFPKEFIDCILKIKTEQLYTKGEFTTPMFMTSDSLMYQVFSTFHKEDSKLELNLAFRGATDVGNGEYAPIESNYGYVFHILPGGVLLLREIWMAG